MASKSVQRRSAVVSPTQSHTTAERRGTLGQLDRTHAWNLKRGGAEDAEDDEKRVEALDWFILKKVKHAC